MRALTRAINVIELPRTSLTSGRLLASLCQHFSATFQAALEVPGASKSRGFCGRLPFETMGGYRYGSYLIESDLPANRRLILELNNAPSEATGDMVSVPPCVPLEQAKSLWSHILCEQEDHLFFTASVQQVPHREYLKFRKIE